MLRAHGGAVAPGATAGSSRERPGPDGGRAESGPACRALSRTALRSTTGSSRAHFGLCASTFAGEPGVGMETTGVSTRPPGGTYAGASGPAGPRERVNW
jgi:hypothetical protein